MGPKIYERMMVKYVTTIGMATKRKDWLTFLWALHRWPYHSTSKGCEIMMEDEKRI